ncbi:PREDICTED: nuclear export mediator factor Nemf-like [Amphimedon queenslandica]|uniref:NFACT RNA-binding domain-containing protein n=1 Tax=Amphimedon queenslandica TaxID=400682 RepID=A0A1X7V5X2_AMPQE|nr:PREDICTED: nuclear export mediator factor Nemf-like [Amphimedon queenslandica]|eukprot:XP_019850525.1 PREDICTED: nuclear export mediator factor Nemf-like [Amphimedon queenslandica]
MKERFTTVDLLASIEYLNRRLTGMRVANIYDVDHKTYLLKLARSEEKIVLLVESGCRLHTTEFEWPKHLQPSGFAMKLRKHLRTKRLISITQLGVDRVIDMVFGSGEYAHHLIIELYDRGNIILTDHTYLILSLLRTRTDADADVRFAVREHFSMDTIKQEQILPSIEQVAGILGSAKPGDQLRHILNPHFVYGTSLLTHCLIGIGLTENTKLPATNDSPIDPDQVLKALLEAHEIFQSFRSMPSKGYLIQKKDVAPTVGVATSDTPTTSTEVTTNIEFHPLLYRQHLSSCYKEVETFDRAVDEFFSSKSSQKQDVKVIQLQKSAVKKLENIKQDHEKRIEALRKSQDEDRYKAELIEWNTDLVERACLVIRSAVASSMDWGDIELLVHDAQGRGDPVANSIQGLKLHSNLITLWLKAPYEEDDDDSDDEDIPKKKKKKPFKGIKVDIDLGLSVYANARRYYDMKKQAAKKEQKTSESSNKALKSAERKTKQTLKEAAVISRITKARKVHWFEKFYWFISSENFVVIGGRDQQQNELLVKKYLNEHDVYVHADLHGATSVIVKNHSGGPVPPKTLNEAGVMAVCYSSAWEAKIVTSAWWVYANQVSKTAPSGEYLTTGSFMIRGKKNFLPPCHLVLGFSIMFKVDESSLANHINERRVRSADEDQLSIMSDSVSEILLEEEIIEEDEEEIEGEEHNDQPLEEGKGAELKEDESDNDEVEFPDTAVSIQASTSTEGGGVRLQVQRVDSTVSVEDSEATPLNGEGRVTYHRHISAKERKLLKKQSSSKGHEASSTPASSKPHPKPQPLPQPQSQQYKRGQKSKQKKIKDKYGDQDEEEREMRMNLLASSGALKESKGKKGKGKGGGNGGKRSGDIGQSFNPKDKYHHKKKSLETANNVLEQHHRQQPPALLVQQEEEMEQTVSDTAFVVVNNDNDDTKRMDSDSTHEILSTDLVTSFTDTNQSSSSITPSLYDPSSTDTVHTTSDTVINHDSTTDQQFLSTNTTISSPPPVTNDESLPPSTTEVVNDEMESDEEEKRAILADENILQLEEAQKEMFDLDSLTGSPLPNDELLYAIPVCAPYSAMHNYKFKVKLIPGTNRRGKAAKTAVHKFVQSKDSTQLEKDLLRSIKDNDLSRYFPGKVKMTLPQQSLRTKHK